MMDVKKGWRFGLIVAAAGIFSLAAAAMIRHLAYGPADHGGDTAWERDFRAERQTAEAHFAADPGGVVAGIAAMIEAGDYRGADRALYALQQVEDDDLDRERVRLIAAMAAAEESAREDAARRQLEAGWAPIAGRSKMDDSPYYTVSKRARADHNGWLARYRAEIIARCREGRMDFILSSGGSLFEGRSGQAGRVDIRYRIDDHPAVKGVWVESTNDRSVFAPDPARLIAALKGAERLTIEFLPFDAGLAVVEFDMHGFSEQADHIESACARG